MGSERRFIGSHSDTHHIPILSNILVYTSPLKREMVPPVKEYAQQLFLVRPYSFDKSRSSLPGKLITQTMELVNNVHVLAVPVGDTVFNEKVSFQYLGKYKPSHKEHEKNNDTIDHRVEVEDPSHV